MATYTDTHDYTLGASSTPWRSSFGNPAIYPAFGEIGVSYDDIVTRFTALSGSFEIAFDMYIYGSGQPIANAYNVAFHLTIEGSTSFVPGVQLLIGGLRLLGMRYGTASTTTIGDFDSSYISNQTIRYNAFWNNTDKQLAVRITHSLGQESSGWVTLSSTTSNKPLLISNNQTFYRPNNTTTHYVRVKTISITDGLTVAQLQNSYNSTISDSDNSSFSIGDINTICYPFPEPIITPAIKWIFDSAGNPKGSDRGAAYDIYESKVKFIDTENNINAIILELDSNREAVSLSNFDTIVFSPEVSHTGTITCAHEIIGDKRRVFNSTSVDDVYELSVKFRAISPSLIGTSASLSTLKIQEALTADQSWSLGRAFSESGAHFYADRRRDVGRLQASFSQTTAQLQAILAYLLTTARASTITLPTFSGLTYPFGYLRGVGPFNAKVLSFGISRANLNRWTLDIEFAEVA